MATKKRTSSNPVVAARAAQLREVQTQVNLLRGALHELAVTMSASMLPFHRDAWPGGDDPEIHVTVMKRLIDLAEIVHGVGVAAEHLGDVDTRACARQARRVALRYGRGGEGRFGPSGHRGAAEAKDFLLELIQRTLDDPAHAADLQDAFAEALVSWFFLQPQGGGGPFELTIGLKWSRIRSVLKATLVAALGDASPADLRDPEKVIKTVWRALGASSDVVRNFFSYRDHRN